MAIIANMKSASISELKNRLSAYLDMVRAGESVVVLDRDRPVAIIERVGPAEGHDPRIARLERAGLLRPPATDEPLDLDALRQAVPVSAAGLLEALVEERRQGR